MNKINALEFSKAGDKYLGRPYAEMDCQAFVERCMADCGYRKDLAGSNAWYRECMKSGWAGTPEECVKAFGLVPKGALLFILEKDGKEPAKYRGDGVGNASHIGIKTGRGKGAIHSSCSRGCVAESGFHDKTIRNGGWNRVGLLACFDYETGNSELLPAGGKEEEKKMTVTVNAPGGTTVNMRQKPSKSAPLVERVPDGTEAELLESLDGWSRIRCRGRTGWMMTEFLVTDESMSGNEGLQTFRVIISGLDLTQAQALVNNYPGRSRMEEDV